MYTCTFVLLSTPGPRNPKTTNNPKTKQKQKKWHPRPGHTGAKNMGGWGAFWALEWIVVGVVDVEMLPKTQLAVCFVLVFSSAGFCVFVFFGWGGTRILYTHTLHT
jgi:hypothetical protein